MRNTFFVPLLLGSALLAQNPNEPPRADIDGRLGLDFTTQYFFRGIVQENQGIIAQPWIELEYGVYDGDSNLHDVKVVAGQWNSLHDGPTGGTGGIWYESRFYIGAEGELGDRLTAGVRYNTYDSPNGTGLSATGNLRPVQEFALYADYDDTGVFSDEWSLQPHVLLAHELVGQRDAGTDRGTYFEVGIEPSFEIAQFGDKSVTLSVPVTLGLGVGDYFERTIGGNADALGFLQFGAEASMPIGGTNGQSPLEMHAGLHFLLLGDNNEGRNSGDAAEVFFTFGMSTLF